VRERLKFTRDFCGSPFVKLSCWTAGVGETCGRGRWLTDYGCFRRIGRHFAFSDSCNLFAGRAWASRAGVAWDSVLRF
jgi:hypothetical protein